MASLTSLSSPRDKVHICSAMVYPVYAGYCSMYAVCGWHMCEL